MQVRYHIVPKKQQRTAVLIETKNRTVNIKNVLSKEAAFKELQQKLENWYEIKQIPIASLNSDDNNILSYRWSLANRDNSAEEFLEDADMPPGFEDDFFHLLHWMMNQSACMMNRLSVIMFRQRALLLICKVTILRIEVRADEVLKKM